MAIYDRIIPAALCIQNLGAVPSDCVAWRRFFKKFDKLSLLGFITECIII